MDNDLVATYRLIYAFLKRQAHPKAAHALQNAVKHLGVLQDGVDTQGPQLDEIVRDWKARLHDVPPSEEAGSDSDSSDHDSVHEKSSDDGDSSDAALPITKKPKFMKKDTSSESESSDASSDSRVTKKRRTTESGGAVTTSTIDVSPKIEQNNGRTGRRQGKPERKVATPFKRVNPDKIKIDAAKDNRYEAKGGPSNDYGQRAHQDLIATRGVGFRKEKNKKKRGSYRGGEITLQSHSFKFTDD